MKPDRLPALDWLKATGMALIVLGHIGWPAFDRLTPPIYPKQLGVAFFLFATGFSLARERRSTPDALRRRLSDVFVYGLGMALIMSALTYARIQDLAESNYLPFALGINVVLSDFPANPTTWYIGTYIHVLLLWAVVRRRLRPAAWMIPAAAAFEVVARALISTWVGPFPAYMMLTNWITVLTLGYYVGSRSLASPTLPVRTRSALAPLLVFAALLTVWPAWAWSVARPTDSFPFMAFRAPGGLASPLLSSAAITLLYLSYTWSAWRLATLLPESTIARFFARNTLIIFLAHMPLYYALGAWVSSLTGRSWQRLTILFAICFLGVAVLSELICNANHRLRQLWSRPRPATLQHDSEQYVQSARADRVQPCVGVRGVPLRSSAMNGGVDGSRLDVPIK